MNYESKNKNSNNFKKLKTTPCKFFLTNGCSKGHSCEFLHEKVGGENRVYDCNFINGVCTKKDCKLKHLSKEIPECPYFKNGYCKEGSECKYRHIKRELCLNYLIGFCPDGPNCVNFHLKSLISKEQDNPAYLLRK